MKAISMFVAGGLIVTAGGALRHVSAQAQQPAQKAAPLRDPLADWQYPGAKNREESNGERLPVIPLHGIYSQTADPIDSVFLFYRKKSEPGFVANESNTWRPEFQFTMLMTQFAQGAQSANFFNPPRKDSASALMIIHQPKRTITVQISRDPQDKSMTDILLVVDEH